MGKRGTKRKPAEQHILQGTFRGDRHKKPAKAEGTLPPCPSYLDINGRSEWRRVARAIAAWGCANPIDYGMLVIMCQSWSLMRRLTKKTDKMLRDDEITIEYQRLMTCLMNSRATYQRIAVLFGVTPSARNGIDLGGGAGATDEDSEQAKKACGF